MNLKTNLLALLFISLLSATFAQAQTKQETDPTTGKKYTVTTTVYDNKKANGLRAMPSSRLSLDLPTEFATSEAIPNALMTEEGKAMVMVMEMTIPYNPEQPIDMSQMKEKGFTIVSANEFKLGDMQGKTFKLKGKKNENLYMTGFGDKTMCVYIIMSYEKEETAAVFEKALKTMYFDTKAAVKSEIDNLSYTMDFEKYGFEYQTKMMMMTMFTKKDDKESILMSMSVPSEEKDNPEDLIKMMSAGLVKKLGKSSNEKTQKVKHAEGEAYEYTGDYTKGDKKMSLYLFAIKNGAETTLLQYMSASKYLQVNKYG